MKAQAEDVIPLCNKRPKDTAHTAGSSTHKGELESRRRPTASSSSSFSRESKELGCAMPGYESQGLGLLEALSPPDVSYITFKRFSFSEACHKILHARCMACLH